MLDLCEVGEQAKSSKLLSKVLFHCFTARFSTSLHSGGYFELEIFRKHKQPHENKPCGHSQLFMLKCSLLNL